jgi:hypothetical protein
MAFMKHVGKHGDRKICILFRQVPGEDHMALVIYPESASSTLATGCAEVVESDIAQQAEELADAYTVTSCPTAVPILETLHSRAHDQESTHQ